MIQIYSNRNFLIFNVNEIDKINFDLVLETSKDTLRKSVDQTKTFVKFDLPTPSSIASLTTKSQEYTYDEFLPILATSEWTAPDPLP